MSERENPDVAFAIDTFRRACKHPRECWRQGSIAVGSGHQGVYGCRMETATFCGDCDQVVPMSAVIREMLAEEQLEPRQPTPGEGSQQAPSMKGK